MGPFSTPPMQVWEDTRVGVEWGVGGRRAASQTRRLQRIRTVTGVFCRERGQPPPPPPPSPRSTLRQLPQSPASPCVSVHNSGHLGGWGGEGLAGLVPTNCHLAGGEQNSRWVLQEGTVRLCWHLAASRCSFHDINTGSENS